MKNQMFIPNLSPKKAWYHCPNCGKHLLIYAEGAKCSGVFLRCKECRKVIEIKI